MTDREKQTLGVWLHERRRRESNRIRSPIDLRKIRGVCGECCRRCKSDGTLFCHNFTKNS